MHSFDQLTATITGRRSIREFNDRPLDPEEIQKIIEIAAHAPSNNNRQGWQFYVVHNRDTLETIADRVKQKITRQEAQSGVLVDFLSSYRPNFTHFLKAPVVVVCCFIKPSRTQLKVFAADEENNHLTGELISLSLAMQNILLLAESAGIGTLMMTSPLIVVREIKELLAIPPKYQVGAFICMGHYDQKPPSPPHKPLDDILFWK